MRISDDRYDRDRNKMEIALRLIRHEARTLTIREWTGLSDDRIRKLYRSYVASGAAQPIARHRGKSPRQPAFFFKNHGRSFEAAQLASVYLMFGLLKFSALGIEAAADLRTLPSCLLICEAYETYLEIHAPSEPLSFEHAWLLLLALARRREIGVLFCERCDGLNLRDLLARRPPACGNCEEGSLRPDFG